MNAELLDSTITQAFKALNEMSERDIAGLSLLDCAIALSLLPESRQLAGIRPLLAHHLCSQLNTTWIHDADLFEVFCVLEAVWKYDKALITGDHLTSAIQRLVASEIAVGGPYASQNRVEIAANLQIASFVRRVAQPLPAISAFFDRVLVSDDVERTELTDLYILKLFTHTYDKPILTDYVHTRQTDAPGYRAVALLLLSKEDTKTQQQLLSHLIRDQLPTGLWTGESLLRGIPPSSLATTCFVAGTLAEYQKSIYVNTHKSPALLRQHQAVTKATRHLFDGRAEPMRSLMLTAVKRVCSSDSGHEITLISYLFAHALVDPPRIPSQQYITLGTASVCGWIAYTIYDDFLDGEGLPTQLPAANVAMRASLDCFRTALPNPDFQQYVADIFIRMDEANAWEVSNCRFTVHDETVTICQLPNYATCDVLADRSFAHALGPIAVLMQLSNITPRQFRHTESAFRHYLIARQLCDDTLDWIDDVWAGQSSYVVTAILRDMRVQPGSYLLSDLVANMQKKFRRTTMLRICKLTLRHITLARRDFMQNKHIKTENSFYVLLDKLESNINESLDQYEKARTFMKPDNR